VDLDVGVILVVLQTDVEEGAVFLDQVQFKDERFQFRTDHNPFNIRDLFHQAAGLVIPVRQAVEIRAHTVAQVNRFTDVNDLLVGITVDITAGFLRQGIQDALQVLVCFSHKGILAPDRVLFQRHGAAVGTRVAAALEHTCNRVAADDLSPAEQCPFNAMYQTDFVPPSFKAGNGLR